MTDFTEDELGRYDFMEVGDNFCRPDCGCPDHYSRCPWHGPNRKCGVEHPTYGPCDLPLSHRGAHRRTRVVSRNVYDYWGTNEPGSDPITAHPINSTPKDTDDQDN